MGLFGGSPTAPDTDVDDDEFDGGKDTYWYCYGVTPRGKQLLQGPFATEPEAADTLRKLRDGELFELPTRDVSRAKQMIRSKLMKRRNVSPDDAMKPIGSRWG